MEAANDRRGDGQGTVWREIVGPNLAGRAKEGTKRSLLTEGHGLPMGPTASGANTHDKGLLGKSTLGASECRRGQTVYTHEWRL